MSEALVRILPTAGAIGEEVGEEFDVHVVCQFGVASGLPQLCQVSIRNFEVFWHQIGQLHIFDLCVCYFLTHFPCMDLSQICSSVVEDEAHLVEGCLHGRTGLVEPVVRPKLLQGCVQTLQPCRRLGQAVDSLDAHGAVFLQDCALQHLADAWVFHEDGVHPSPLCAGSSCRQLIQHDL